MTHKVTQWRLYSLLLSLGNPTVDFLSLDIEGAEFQVLTNIPWESVDIRAISVETQFAGEVHFRLLTSLGYTHLADMEKVAGTAGTPAEPPAKKTLNRKFPLPHCEAACGTIEHYFHVSI